MNASDISIMSTYFQECLVQNVMLWPFDPAQNAIQGDAPEGSDTMAVMWGNRVGENWLMKWDEQKKIPMVHSKTDAPEESDLWTAWQLFPLDGD